MDITPYIITIDRNTGYVNYTEMKKLGVIGVMIEAGSLFDVTHREVSFRNPKLDEQYRTAKKNDLPVALYIDVRSRSVAEANRELYELELTLRRYPPELGIWLRIGLAMTKATNDNIITTYQNRLLTLGFKGRMGVYATPTQLKQISWNKFYNDWYLWLNEHVSNTNVLDNILTPDFFIVDRL